MEAGHKGTRDHNEYIRVSVHVWVLRDGVFVGAVRAFVRGRDLRPQGFFWHVEPPTLPYAPCLWLCQGIQNIQV